MKRFLIFSLLFKQADIRPLKTMSDIDWLSVLVYIIDPDLTTEPELFMTLSGGRHMSKQKIGLERGKKYILSVTADAPGVEGLHTLQGTPSKLSRTCSLLVYRLSMTVDNS